ncbi:G1/S-specific cyclin-E2 [Coemansia spiralis]|uniref:G1/S-specific cyclin-E2 n=2 Tax=Coemansia TaxID=4863 RepID=A0A9W8GBM6_9FUNG|nr:hypothetical protein BX070DRAFT_233145 [Coemansia spiralis]KAJ1990563.1 G1/S-specific cyclin-E2 [Coemansia umbellata]KAJ2624897.1 G1/S-specific cyclin-E2 [Coemansia sp. RSA 1358]KAJ2679196.1 G1/S-specific cyclin-E2 [Coemansia spiralis]
MPRSVNKENAVIPNADLGLVPYNQQKQGGLAAKVASVTHTCADLLEPAASSKPKGTRKRALEEIADNDVIESFVDKAKKAIKRGCAEMGIRKYASLSSMSANHTRTACHKQSDSRPQRPTRKRSCISRKPSAHDSYEIKDIDPSSEATIILLPSDSEAKDDDEEALGASISHSFGGADLDDSTLLESQITLVAPSSPIHPSVQDIDDSNPLPPSGTHVFGTYVPALAAADDDYPSTHEELAEWMLEIERQYALRLDKGLSRHPELSSRMRPILIDWLMEVAADYRMYRQTLHLTVQYLDRFLARTSLKVQPSMLQCYGTACLSIAMKMEEKHVPTLAELTDFSKDAFTREQLKQAELDVLTALGWHLAVPTTFDFLCLAFQRAALHFPKQFADSTAVGKDKTDWQPSSYPAAVPRRFNAQQFTVACDYIDILLHNQSSLRFSASEIAAACFYLGTAPNSLDGPMFAQCTGYSFVDILPTILHVKRLKAKLDPTFTATLRAKQCCEIKDRYTRHLKRIRPAELWAIQPHHSHLLREFEDLYASQ